MRDILPLRSQLSQYAAHIDNVVHFVGGDADKRNAPTPTGGAAEESSAHTRRSIRLWTPAVFSSKPPAVAAEKQPAEGQIEVAGDRQQALAFRREWMRLIGAAEDEIEEACSDPDEQVSRADEEANLLAARRLKQSTPSAAEMLGWKNRY